jgi:hypothetical protein
LEATGTSITGEASKNPKGCQEGEEGGEEKEEMKR